MNAFLSNARGTRSWASRSVPMLPIEAWKRFISSVLFKSFYSSFGSKLGIDWLLSAFSPARSRRGALNPEGIDS